MTNMSEPARAWAKANAQAHARGDSDPFLAAATIGAGAISMMMMFAHDAAQRKHERDTFDDATTA